MELHAPVSKQVEQSSSITLHIVTWRSFTHELYLSTGNKAVAESYVHRMALCTHQYCANGLHEHGIGTSILAFCFLKLALLGNRQQCLPRPGVV